MISLKKMKRVCEDVEKSSTMPNRLLQFKKKKLYSK